MNALIVAKVRKMEKDPHLVILGFNGFLLGKKINKIYVLDGNNFFRRINEEYYLYVRIKEIKNSILICELMKGYLLDELSFY